ncbi:hypothetical protein RAM07_02080 [Lactobacillus helsingborgensis]|uniref:hypothetical protein n=1 Tax=Lactobacillus TaxID=1578 RepID=UPI002741B5FC|nr:hypothetical protein [Lactobacillus helsingborgensis]MCT6889585.1 hypothetical protein [Lactobacillus sp.]WLT00782.1 hypothetical protein RAM07_02080 [Lactobacillus helsingborgensis]
MKTNYYKIISKPINHSIMEQSLLDVTDKHNNSLFPWRGQFTPDFAVNMISTFSSKNSILLDPFAGSGNSLYAGILNKIPSFGVELNPAAFFMSNFFVMAKLTIEQRKTIINKVQHLLDSCLFSDQIISIILKDINTQTDNIVKTLESLLIVLLDIKDKSKVNYIEIEKKWSQISEKIMALPVFNKDIKVYRGDIRSIHAYPKKPNLVFTSPPYINVFNYHQNYRKSVELLGYNVLNIAKKEFGSNRRNRSNRFKTVTEYCIDMSLSINSILNSIQFNSTIIFVIGRQSNILGIPIYNSNIVNSIFSSIFNLSLNIHQERKFTNKFGNIVYEDILHFKYNKKNKLAVETIIDQAKILAKNVLQDALERAKHSDEKIITLLTEAINGVESINPSPN